MSEYFALVRRHVRWFALGLLIALVAAAALLALSGRGYESRATVLVWTPSSADVGNATLGSQYAMSRAPTYVNLALSPGTAAAVAESVGGPQSAIAGTITATSVPGTPLIELTLRQPTGAAAGAAMVALVDDLRLQVNSIEQAAGQLDPRASLVVVDEPRTLPRTSYTHGGLIALGAFVLGLVLGGLLVVGRSFFADLVRSTEDASAAAGAPVLGVFDDHDASATARPIDALIRSMIGAGQGGSVVVVAAGKHTLHEDLARALASIRTTGAPEVIAGNGPHPAGAPSRARCVIVVCDVGSTTLQQLRDTADAAKTFAAVPIAVVLTHLPARRGPGVLLTQPRHGALL